MSMSQAAASAVAVAGYALLSWSLGLPPILLFFLIWVI